MRTALTGEGRHLAARLHARRRRTPKPLAAHRRRRRNSVRPGHVAARRRTPARTVDGRRRCAGRRR
jgi:hypothetical protein